MANKIITEDDSFQCTGGMMPSPFQSKQLIVKKADSAKYITEMDISTLSWVDFGCKKVMLLYAVVAAVAALVAALCVATGGAALIAICAIAGAAGAALGAVIGTLICGQLVAPTRKWLGSKSNFQILGINTITGDHSMECDAFVMLNMSPEFIAFAPNIKSWGQAIAMGSASFLANVLQGALTGMMIGAAGIAIPALFTQGATALAGGGISQLGRFLGTNLIKNYFASWFTAGGLGIRGAITLQTTLDAYGTTGEVTGTDIRNGIFGLELGTANSAVNVVTGNANVLDIIGLTLWFSPTSQVIRENAKPRTESKVEARTETETKTEAKPKNEGEVVETSGTEAKSNETSKNGDTYERGKIMAEDLGIKMLKDNPKLMEIYKEALRRMAESTQDNAYKKYMEARNNDFNGKNQAEIQALCEEVWARVRQKMGVVAKEQNIFIDGEIHHWNYPKYENPYDVLNPNQLTEPINRSIHTEVHQQTTSNASDPWKGPIDPNNRINVEPYEYPQPHK